MQAFHNDPKVKEHYLRRVRAHQRADQLVHGTYWTGTHGCAVGCTIHSGQHENYEQALGIPTILARLEDHLFETMSPSEAQWWPERFLSAIPMGADLSGVVNALALWILDEGGLDVGREADPQSREAIREVRDLQARRVRGDTPTVFEWSAVYARLSERYRLSDIESLTGRALMAAVAVLGVNEEHTDAYGAISYAASALEEYRRARGEHSDTTRSEAKTCIANGLLRVLTQAPVPAPQPTKETTHA